MAKGELFIRTSRTGGFIDVYDAFGVSFTDASLSALMTYPSMKAAVENKSRLEHGKRVINKEKYAKTDERDVTLEMHITAKNKAQFFQRYMDFNEIILKSQFLDIRSGYLDGIVFHMTYESCTQFSEFMQQIAKFSLRLNEPNPDNRV